MSFEDGNSFNLVPVLPVLLTPRYNFTARTLSQRFLSLGIYVFQYA